MSLTRAVRGAVLVAPLGYASGLVAMEHILQGDSPPIWIAAGIVAVLSAIAGAIGQQPKQPALAALATFGCSIVASALCAPCTFIALVVTTGYDTATGGDVVDELGLVTFFGAFIGVPIGAALGTAYALVAGISAWAWRDGAVTRASATISIAGAVASIAGVILTGVGLENGAWVGHVLALGGAYAAVSATLYLVGMDLFVHRVRAGKVAGYALATPEPGTTLAPLLPWGARDAVLVRVRSVPAGPFRSAEIREERALVPA